MRRIASGLAIIALFLSSSSCKKRERAEFRFINRGDVITLDLNQMSYAQDFRVTYAIREGLFQFDQATMQGVKALATSAEASADGKTWTFKIRPEARWSNGDPVVAGDFVFGWRLMLESPGEYTSLFYYFRNAEKYQAAYTEGKMDQLPELGFRAVDAHTLQVELANPVPFLAELLAFPPFYPRHEPSMRPFRSAPDKLGRVTYDGKYTRPPWVVTNGPFKIAEWRQGDRIRMEKDENYWGAARVRLRSVEMVVNNDPLSAFQQFEAGDVDWLTDPAPSLAFDVKQLGRETLKVGPGFGTQFLTVNCQPEIAGVMEGKNPLADARVRRALNMALDKKVITDQVTRMGEEPATKYVPPGIFTGFKSKPADGTDLEKAKALLAEAGYPGGKGMQALTITYNTDSTVRGLVAQVLKNQWESRLGVTINLNGMELKGYRGAVKAKKYELALVAWFGDYPDPSTFTDKYRSTSENNDSAWAPPAYDRLLDAAASEPDARKRLDLLQQAEDMINADSPIIPLYHAVNLTFVQPGVHDMVLNPMTTTDYKPIWTDRSARRAAAEAGR